MFQNDRYKTVSCAHKTPRVNVDGWMNGWTNGQKLAHLSCPAKAGATKKTGRITPKPHTHLKTI